MNRVAELAAPGVRCRWTRPRRVSVIAIAAAAHCDALCGYSTRRRTNNCCGAEWSRDPQRMGPVPDAT